MKKRLLIVFALPLLMFLPMILSRQSPHAKTVRRIAEQYWNAERPVLRPGGGTREVERFLGDLKAISTDGAPQEVQLAFTRMIVAVEANLHTRTFGDEFDTNAINAANERVAEAKRELVIQFDRYRGHLD
jgi:hypothetical protein